MLILDFEYGNHYYLSLVHFFHKIMGSKL